MINCSILFILILSAFSLHARFVFEPGSDVGYIVPDEVSDSDYETSKKKFIQENKIKKEVKRAFWNTLLDSVAEFGSREISVRNSEREGDRQPFANIPENLKDEKRGVAMGISDQRCDDGKTNLQVDWDGSPKDYTCYTPKTRLEVRLDLQPLETCDDDIPPDLTLEHFCMNYSIVYNTSIPTVAPHRPLWPVFGEYKFVPLQRWLHSVEHGSIVMLYHPCTEPLLVRRLKALVKKCVYKHVITPYNKVTIDRPLVLVAWGCKLEMAVVDEELVVDFIREKALKGPEGTLSKQGSFSQELLVKSVPPAGSDINDSVLCPSFI